MSIIVRPQNQRGVHKTAVLWCLCIRGDCLPRLASHEWAFAAALSCGILALMVSRGGALLLDGIPGLKRLPRKKENSLRLVSGCVAGLGVGFNGAFWFKAVIADVWPLSLLFLSLVLCLLLRWIHAPERNAYLFTAWLLFGLTLTNSHALPVAAPGIAFMVLFGE